MTKAETFVVLRERERATFLKNKERLKSQTLKREKIKNNVGITLIALVVTIVILLILAGITINAIMGEGGLINRAKIAENKTVQGAENDINAINDLANQLEEIIDGPKGPWTYDKATQTVTDGNTPLHIGDYVDYDCKTGATTPSYTSPQAKNGYGEQTFTLADYNYGWRVLGANDNGQLLLIAEDFVPLTGGKTVGNRTLFYLGNDSNASLAQSAYVNGVSELNKICSIYGQGAGAIGATGARSVKLEDIDKITGFNPNENNPFSGEIHEYGNEVEYKLESGKIKYKGSKMPTSFTDSNLSSFTYYTGSTWKTLQEGESATIRSNYYGYYPNTLTASQTGETLGIDPTSKVYKMLFTNSSTGAESSLNGQTDNFRYWLGSSFARTRSGDAYFGVCIVNAGGVGGGSLFFSSDLPYSRSLGVRPVVTLESYIQLIDSETTRDGCTLWNITWEK